MSSSSSTPKKRRAYIGNLRSRPNLAHSLYNNLFIPYSLPVRNFPNSNDNGAIGITIATLKNASSNSYALVEFTDVEYAIQVLDGVMFDGRTLRVSKEKTNFASGGWGGGKGGGFGSSRWAGGGGSGGSRSNKSVDGGNKSQQRKTHQQAHVQPPAKNTAGINKKEDGIVDSHKSEEEAMINKIQTTVTSEIKGSSDEVNAAIACTAAMTLLSTVDAFGMQEDGVDANNNVPNNTTESSITTTRDFQSRCKLPLSELLAEYGEEDPDWKKPQKKQQQPTQVQTVVKNDEVLSNTDFQSRCDMPLSELMAEYGQQDVDWKKHQPNIPSSSSSAQGVNHSQSVKNGNHQTHQQSNSRDKNDNNTDNSNGMLAHFAKAPIHLELLSFGYKYGAPSYSKRGFSYAHPIPPVDVRDLDRAPGHVAKFTGLSYLVKRALLNPTTKVNNADDYMEQQQQPGGAKEVEGDNDNTTTGYPAKELSPMRQRANEIADEIIKVLVESIDEGGHGPISPLTMTISIGSEYGRHRGVVLVEHLAVVLRARLRRNDGREFNDEAVDDDDRPGKNGIVKQPVSVGTRHLHVEARHTDEEAFGQDLKREARKAEKIARRRQQFDDSGWDESW